MENTVCLAVPLKLIEIHGNTAVGEAMGMKREIRVDFIPEPRTGEYVIVHAGFAIERLGEQQAKEDLEAWEEIRDALK
ncbi:MAG: HypC/HybG/HupF family hydrogenase formation chaperone [Candidatus Limivicinus sp.]|nr:HypC/HybG/HupF family hydrogenase formation chaperone [Candidatus Limivicinus sp.]